jgi:hypothetical protein
MIKIKPVVLSKILIVLLFNLNIFYEEETVFLLGRRFRGCGSSDYLKRDQCEFGETKFH